MQERRLRLGDVLDDYCPREKRLTNHAIVALVGDEVRTTRCTTCDFEHVYKQGKVPARRKKPDAQATLYKTVLEHVTGRDPESAGPPLPAVEPEVPPPAAAVVPPAPPPSRAAQSSVPETEVARPSPIAAAAAEPADPSDPPRREEPVHRHTLIRATLPKIDGQVPERKPADFTLWNVARQPQGRRGRHHAQQGGTANWGGYSPYANGHPSGKGPQQGQGGQPGKSRSNHRRGR